MSSTDSGPSQWPCSVRPVTLKDVASRAGVGAMSVSTVLNGGGGGVRYVSEKTRQRILEAAQELGYRPNLSARSMKQLRSAQVGVLLLNSPVQRYVHPLVWEFIMGVNEGLEAGGRIMSLVRLTDVESGQNIGAQALQGHLLDGLITASHFPVAIQKRLEALFGKIVWLDSNVWEDERCIRRDEQHAGETVADAVLNLGYRKIIVLNHQGADNHYSFEARQQGIQRRLDEDAAQASHFTIDREGLKEGWRRLRELLRPDVALITLDAYWAQEVIYLAARDKVAIGRDFALACCDDYFNEGERWNWVSHVSFDRFAMGLQAAQMMLNLLDCPDAPCPSRLIRGVWKPAETMCPVPSA